MSVFLYRLGRFLQLLGLILVPVAIAGNLTPTNPISLRASLMLSGAGVVVFLVGYLVQRASERG